MDIKVTRLEMQNFKGLRELCLNFDGRRTVISGANATGKTTIKDAFTWCLFGKDSTGRSDFEIKTVDAEGNIIPKIDHSVTINLEVDGQPYKFQRVLREKWIKRRGSTELTFDGNETVYFVNGVPMLAKEYQAQIQGILDESNFRLITDPLYFNALKWQDRREVITKIADIPADTEVINSREEFAELARQISGKTLQQYRSELSHKKTNIKKELDQLPARIDEVDRNTPQAEDWDDLRAELADKEAKLDDIDSQLLDQSKQNKAQREEKLRIENEVFAFESKVRKILHEAEVGRQEIIDQRHRELAKVKSDHEIKGQELKTLLNRISDYEARLPELHKRRDLLREDWKDTNAWTFKMPENASVCPTCGREFATEDIESKRAELQAAFNREKLANIADIDKRGQSLKRDIEDIESQLKECWEREQLARADMLILNGRINEMNEMPEPPRVVPENIAEYRQIQAQISNLKGQVKQCPETMDGVLQERKNTIQKEIQEIAGRLSLQSSITEMQNRKAQLMADQKRLAQELADLEKMEFAVQEFTREKIYLVEQRVNSLFKRVRFRMFTTQINGEEVECCDTLVDGVPFTDANTAARINAGIDIINTLCRYYDVTAPIFIDNAESVNTIYESDSQTVLLTVTTDKELLIS